MNFLKYPGGKERELKLIKPILPEFKNYYEPFVGGGSVYLGIEGAEHYYINDRSDDLINLYKCIKNQNPNFHLILNNFQDDWQLIGQTVNHLSEYTLTKFKQRRENHRFVVMPVLTHNKNWCNLKLATDYSCDFVAQAKRSVHSKLKRMLALEQKKGLLSDHDILQNIEGALKAAFYTLLRGMYNDPALRNEQLKAALYLFLRETCYSSMFRFNSKGEFNVPYGGVSYNNKKLNARLDFYVSEFVQEKIKNTTLSCADFEEFLDKYKPEALDFIFLDPPYDSDFSTYDQNAFGKEDQIRLATYLLEKCPCKFLMIIKNTDFISNLYPVGAKCANGMLLNVKPFSHQYQVSFKNRNNKNTEHLLIGNFDF